MNIFLEDNGKAQIPSDIVISWVLRSDIVPVPRTVEFMVLNKDGIEDELKVGSFIWTGAENLQYEIIKVNKSAAASEVQEDSPMQAFTIFAVLASCARICYRSERAIIKRNTTIGEMYRACGAQISIADDIHIDSFASLAGGVPSVAIARVLQEQSACLVIDGDTIRARRYADILSELPKEVIGQYDTTNTVSSEFMERHEIPSFYTIKPDGTADYGNFSKVRQVQYVPRKEGDVLNNMSRVMVTRHIVDSDMMMSINAGDNIRIGDENFATITAAHYCFSIDGIKQTGSKFWVGNLS